MFLFFLCCFLCVFLFFFFNDTATTEIYTLSLHDALPIYISIGNSSKDSIVDRVNEYLKIEVSWDDQVDSFENLDLLGRSRASLKIQEGCNQVCSYCIIPKVRDRKSTRLNSSHW
mgnify:CR=1 FL=1